MKKIFLILLALMIPFSVRSYKDVYNITGDQVFSGESLFEFYGYTSEEGGYNGDYYSNEVHWDRFLRDFGSEVTLYERINDREYELKLGRIPTTFTPLTFYKTRYRWGYPSVRSWEWYKYYNNNNWEWGKFWEQRGIKLTARKGEDQWIGLIAKTAYPGDDDEYEYRGCKWTTANVDRDRYLIGLRRQFIFLKQKIGLSFVNQSYTSYKTSDKGFWKSIKDNEIFPGYINEDAPDTIYIRITDDSPETYKDKNSSAAIYSIKTFLNGNYIYELSATSGTVTGNAVILNYNGRTYNNRIETVGSDEFIIYQFNLTSILAKSDLKSLEFLIDTANDYKIEISRDGNNYYTIYKADGDVDDYSNRDTLRYVYGEHTGNTILGIDLEGVIFGIGYRTEYAASTKYYRFPIDNAPFQKEQGYALTIELTKEFSPFLFTGKYFTIDYLYDASFSVEDNDDNDDKPDMVDDYVAWVNNFDRNQYGGPDYEEDFLLFTIDRAFRDGLDLNNNDTIDHEENDVQPDYPYKWRKGRYGYQIGGAYKPIPIFKWETIYRENREYKTDGKNRTIFNQIIYEIKFPILKIILKNELKRTWDTMRENLVYNPDYPDPGADQRYESWTDSLNYRNNFIFQNYITLDWKIIKDLELISRYRYGDNYRYFNEEQYTAHLGIFRMRYLNWYPFKKLKILTDWQVMPMYKFERDYSEGISDTDKWINYNWSKHSFGIAEINNLTERTRLFIGQQISFKDDYSGTSDFTRYIFAIELTHRNNYHERPIYVTLGMKTVTQESKTDENLEEIYSYYYLKTYFVW